ncbi:ribonuclease H-like domain-containing protein [Tanacetum coccineum]
MGKALVKLVKKVKKMEDVLKRRHVVLPDSEDEDAKISSKQGRNLQEEGLDEMVRNMMKDKSEVFKTPTQSKTSGEEDISPTTLEAAKTLSKVLLTKSKIVSTALKKLILVLRVSTVTVENLAFKLTEEIKELGSIPAVEYVEKQRIDDKDVSDKEKVTKVKEEEPVKRVGKRKKQKARKKSGTNRLKLLMNSVLWSDLRLCFDPPLMKQAIFIDDEKQVVLKVMKFISSCGPYVGNCGTLNGLMANQDYQVAYLLIYVDDIILTTSCLALLQQIIGSLNNEFDMTDLGALNFLGIFADRTPTGLFLSQKMYALQLLELAHMVTCNPSRTPIDTESKLGPEGALVQGTLDLGLHLHASSTTSLDGYTDADWADCPYTSRSTSETAGYRNLLRELHSPLSTATIFYCDNVSAVYMSANPVQHQRMKHIKIDIHFIRDMVTAGQVRVLHVPSRFQYADIFTKGLPFALF